MYLHVDLCCGLGGWQAPFREAEKWRSVGVDIRRGLDPDIVGDVRELPLTRCEPTLVTASPPCTEFSSAWNGVTPPSERDPDMSIYYGCRAAIHHLNPEYWVLENVAQAQYWFGDSVRNVGPYHLWGHFPPVDVGPVARKTRVTSDGSGEWIDDPDEAARIPYHLADAVRRSVEIW